jgi:Domain of unknown function (DUF4193)
VSKPIDYDAPRRPAVEIEEDSLDELRARGTAAKSPGVDLDEVDPAENFELPGAELSGEELTVTVLPMQSDEFRCTRCFLVHHRSQLAAGSAGHEVCAECA